MIKNGPKFARKLLAYRKRSAGGPAIPPRAGQAPVPGGLLRLPGLVLCHTVAFQREALRQSRLCLPGPRPDRPDARHGGSWPTSRPSPRLEAVPPNYIAQILSELRGRRAHYQPPGQDRRLRAGRGRRRISRSTTSSPWWRATSWNSAATPRASPAAGCAQAWRDMRAAMIDGNQAPHARHACQPRG